MDVSQTAGAIVTNSHNRTRRRPKTEPIALLQFSALRMENFLEVREPIFLHPSGTNPFINPFWGELGGGGHVSICFKALLMIVEPLFSGKDDRCD